MLRDPSATSKRQAKACAWHLGHGSRQMALSSSKPSGSDGSVAAVSVTGRADERGEAGAGAPAVVHSPKAPI